MVARIVSGKSIRGILNYNENKIRNAEAKLLLACGYLDGPSGLSFGDKLKRFEMLTSQNEKAKTNALHITLNFSRQDVVDDGMLERIALDYMQRIGFGEQPFLVYRHYDAAHPHIHIATVNIADGGERIETHNIGRNQSEKARKEMEIFYNLVRAEDQQKEGEYVLKPVRLERALYGRSETKAAISSIVREVVGSYRFASLAELNAVLRQFNVLADPGSEGSVRREKGGLVYSLLDATGGRVSVPIKASAIFSSPTIKNLEKRYRPNEMERRPYGLRLKHQIDKALANSRNAAQLDELLRAQGIRILMRRNTMGSVYGITFIDNATRTVFNGSDLGKAYAAKSFIEKLDRISAGGEIFAMPDFGNGNEEHGQAIYPAQDQPAISVIHEHPMRKSDEKESRGQKRKVRKRQQPE
ncbi:relaxase/mobilization nuclease domain-containing protein [Pedobacter sp.]